MVLVDVVVCIAMVAVTDRPLKCGVGVGDLETDRVQGFGRV